MRTTTMIGLPVAILMVGVVGALAIVESRPDPVIEAPEAVVPLVLARRARALVPAPALAGESSALPVPQKL